MMIWINGAFGAGKTTLAEELHRRLPDALPFDPEYVGYLLRMWPPVPDSSDFQDIPLWRRLVAEFATGIAADYGRMLIIPLTLVNPAYREEIFGLIGKAGDRILHVFLDVPPEVLHRRIDDQVLHQDNPGADASARAFRHNSVARCAAARAELPPGTLILRADQHTPAQLAELVIDASEQSASPSPSF